jgi:hypothetical protein
MLNLQTQQKVVYRVIWKERMQRWMMKVNKNLRDQKHKKLFQKEEHSDHVLRNDKSDKFYIYFLFNYIYKFIKIKIQ